MKKLKQGVEKDVVRTPIYVPIDEAGSFWTREDALGCLQDGRLVPHDHVAPRELEAIIHTIIMNPVFQNAVRLLVVDDGVATPLRDAAIKAGKDVYVLDPLSGCILPRMLVAEARISIANGIKVEKTSFVKLPIFDLIVTGCVSCTAKGDVYSSNPHLKMAQMVLQKHVKIKRAKRIVITESTQCEGQNPAGTNYMKASHVASSAGLQKIENKSATKVGEVPQDSAKATCVDLFEINRKVALLAEQLRLLEVRNGKRIFDEVTSLVLKARGYANSEKEAISK